MSLAAALLPEDFKIVRADDGLYLVCPAGDGIAGWLDLPDDASTHEQLRIAREHIVAAHGGKWCRYCRQLVQQWPGANGYRVTPEDRGPWCPAGPNSAACHYPDDVPDSGWLDREEPIGFPEASSSA